MIWHVAVGVFLGMSAWTTAGVAVLLGWEPLVRWWRQRR